MKGLQLPKNKFARLAINAGFIVIWWFLMKDIVFLYLYFYSGYFFSDILKMQNVELVSLLQDLVGLIVMFLPIGLVTKFIWFPKRPKITRSKD